MSFSELKGQERSVKILRQSLVNHPLSRTYLFHGPEGVGKKKGAKIFSKALNCMTERQDACDLCVSCRKIEQGIHPDVTLIQEEKGDIRIDVIRDVIQGMVYRPLEARKRVVIIDDAEKCNISASNAFLKTLEEPPVDTVIILISSSPDTLPQTVQSRCHKIPFGNIPEQVLTDVLIHEKGIAADEAGHAASLAEGSIGRALNLFSAEIMDLRKETLDELVAAEKDHSRIFALAERFSKDEKTFYDVLYWIHTYFRDALIMKCQGSPSLLVNRDRTGHLSAMAARMTIENILHVIELIQFIHKGQLRNMNRQLALDVLGITIASSSVTRNTEKEGFGNGE